MKFKVQTKKVKYLDQKIFFNLLDDFINDSFSGKRVKKNGTRISRGSVDNYCFLKKELQNFTEQSFFEIKLLIDRNLTLIEREKAVRYWRKFYTHFTEFLYKKGFYDNYVGMLIKILRAFFNYLNNERHIDVGSYHKSFYVPKENIPIIALNQEQLKYLIFNKEFNDKLNDDMKIIKDIFVFGCTVALRVSDLLNLSDKNLVIQNQSYYLKVKSQKTGTYTSIKLPDYAVDILKRYKKKQSTLLPKISLSWFNMCLKTLGKLIPDDFEIIKTRERNGKQIVVYKDPEKKIHYKLSDHLCTHTMRRTAITNMLSLGIPEYMVRKISGHAANSKEFFRYVELSQSVLDRETEKFFEKIKTPN